MRKLHPITKIVLSSIFIALSFLPISCTHEFNPRTILSDTANEINKKGNGYDDFSVINTPTFYAILYNLEKTPENKAKVLWLSTHEELGRKFRSEMLNKLKKGDILSRVVEEKKSLVLAVVADEIEYHAVYSPKEISEHVLNN